MAQKKNLASTTTRQERVNMIEWQDSELSITKQVYPSDANFVLAKVTDAPGIYRKLMNLGIIVRDRSNVRLCDNCLRITVGTPRENDRLINVLNQLHP